MMRKTPRVAVLLLTYIPHTRQIFEGVVDYAYEHGPWAIQTDPAIGLEPIDRLDQWQGDAVIGSLSTPALAEQVLRLGVPVVNISSGVDTFGLPCVWPDNEVLGREGAAHFLGLGLESLAYCGNARELFSDERGRGFSAAVAEAGRDCRVYGGSAPLRGDPHWQRRVRALTRWLEGLPKPCGVMACDDYRAIAVIAACDRLGLRVPEDVAVLGVNDDDLSCRITRPPLTSLPLPGYDIGYTAASLIDRALAGEALPAQVLRLPSEPIVVRESTDVLHYSHADVVAAVRQIRREAGRRPVTVEDLADAVGVTPRTLQDHFQQDLGRTPKQEIDRVRTRVLRQKLLQTDWPIKQIAFHTGFASPAEFSRYFKRQTGLTPNGFRAEAKR